MRLLFLTISFVAIFIFSSCEKEYSCVCTSLVRNQDTLMDRVKTTKIGSKGYNETCLNYEKKSSHLKDCHLE